MDYSSISFDLKDEKFTDRKSDSLRYIPVCKVWGPDSMDLLSGDRQAVRSRIQAMLADFTDLPCLSCRGPGQGVACGLHDFPAN